MRGLCAPGVDSVAGPGCTFTNADLTRRRHVYVDHQRAVLLWLSLLHLRVRGSKPLLWERLLRREPAAVAQTRERTAIDEAAASGDAAALRRMQLCMYPVRPDNIVAIPLAARMLRLLHAKEARPSIPRG
jgi:hypothetical protein